MSQLPLIFLIFFFFNDTATTEIYTLSLHDALPICGATREQSQGIDQINDAIIQLDQVTQQNAALVEESAAAAGSLSQQAQALVSAVSIFKLDPAEKEAPVLRKIPSPMRPLSLSAS